MPRYGWAKGAKYIRDKFKSNLSDLGFKTKATRYQNLGASDPESCPDDESKRLKTDSINIDEYGLRDAKLYLQVKTLFLSKIENSKKTNIEDAQRTRKIPSEKLDHQLLEILNRLVGEYVSTHRPKNMTEIARILQAVQCATKRRLINRSQYLRGKQALKIK
ncbi:hypothetical protein NAPIS_ORF01495 [Vairimorpha apis BRL 01]|uniref:Uncharacterized protein n=1 Tax=Vairimorpha apis BRL 01 TaxID=1037528 RepID=T0L082_9MICR|nr:hypothetical protein NAPIS_ORF01495 [Vairimorpha apis BRL 01]